MASFAGTDFEKVPGWWADQRVNLEEYLRKYALELAPRGERAVGVRLTYGLIEQHQLWEYLERRLKEGSFCVIRFDRPPLDCLTSMRMAEKKRPRVSVDPAKAYAFIRRHAAVKLRVARLFGDDLMTVRYGDWLSDTGRTLREIAEYVELPNGAVRKSVPSSHPPGAFRPGQLRAHLQNSATIVAEAPVDVREILDDRP